MKTKTIIVAALIVAGVSLIVRFSPHRASSGGTTVTGFTPDWLAHTSSAIFEGVPLRAEPLNVSMTGSVTTVQFRVDRVIKGPFSVGDLVTIVSHRHGPGLDDRAVFTRATDRKAVGLVFASIAQHRAPEIDGRYEFMSFYWPGAFFADEPVNRIYDETGAAIQGYDSLRDRVVAQASKEASLLRGKWLGKIAMSELTVGEHTDAYREINDSGSVLLLALDYQNPKR